MSPPRTRLPAAERRRALVDAALVVFTQASYAGATTAGIAREAGVTEPVLYRHFASKKELYFACLDDAWAQLRDAIEAKVEELGPARGHAAIAHTSIGLRRARVLPPNLWVQAIAVAGDDEEIRSHLRGHMREVHAFLAGVLRGAQDAGGIPADRDPVAEAWIFVAGMLLVTIGDRLGGVLGPDDLGAIATQRYRWLVGRDPDAPIRFGP